MKKNKIEKKLLSLLILQENLQVENNTHSLKFSCRCAVAPNSKYINNDLDTTLMFILEIFRRRENGKPSGKQ